MSNFRKLEVYNEAVDFTVAVYKFITILPKHEQYALIDQLRRAVTSIVLNIAEGSGSSSKAEFIRFLRIALRSLYEVDAILELCVKLGYCSKLDIKIIYQQRIGLGNKLGRLIQKVSKP